MNASASALEPATPTAGNRRLILAALVIGAAMVNLDSTIVNVALPAIGTSLHADGGIEWTITVYLLAMAAVQPASGWIADRFGRRHFLLWSMAVFTVASLGCALSPNIGTLIACRALQGLGGGAIIPVSMSIVFGIFPRSEHGRAISIWAMAATVPMAFGPTLGGWFVTEFSWHWLFMINVPIGIGGLVLAMKVIPPAEPVDATRLDAPGLALGVVGLTLLVLGVSQSAAWSWWSVWTVGSLTIGVAALIGFIRRSLVSPAPVLQLALLRPPLMRLAVGLLFLLQIVNFGRTVFIPLELATVRDYSAMHIGLLVAPGAIITAALMPLSGRLVDRVGVRTPMMIGFALMLVGSVTLSCISTTTPGVVIALALCLHGGYGFTSTANLVAGMSDVPREAFAAAAALRSVAILVSGSVSVAAFSALSSALIGTSADREDAQRGFNAIFAVTALTLVVCIWLARRLPRGRRVGPEKAPLALAIE